MYLTSVFLSFFSVLVFRRINEFRDVSPRWEFDSHAGHHFSPAVSFTLIDHSPGCFRFLLRPGSLIMAKTMVISGFPFCV